MITHPFFFLIKRSLYIGFLLDYVGKKHRVPILQDIAVSATKNNDPQKILLYYNYTNTMDVAKKSTGIYLVALFLA